MTRLRLVADAAVRADPELCVQCGTCSTHCPLGLDVRALVRTDGVVSDRRCLSCGECVRRCPRHALRFVARGEVRACAATS